MARRKITITSDGSIVVIRGYKVADIARAAGLRPTYSASAGGWMLDMSRLPELVAWLEYRNFRYELDDQTATTSIVPAVDTEPCPVESQAALW